MKNSARRVLSVTRMGYAPVTELLRFRIDSGALVTVTLRSLPAGLSVRDMQEASGLGSRLVALRELGERIAWFRFRHPIVPREELEALAGQPLSTALCRTKGVRAFQPVCPIEPDCILLNGLLTDYRTLDMFRAEELEMVELMPKEFRNWAASRGCAKKPRIAIVWMRR